MFAADQIFLDRTDAGRQLATHLQGESADLVLALPRGGVPVAFEVARGLDLPLDLLLVRKIPAPGHEEFGIGAVVEGDPPQAVLNSGADQIPGVDADYLREQTRKKSNEIEARRVAYLGERRRADLKGKAIILVDDGIATGGTVRAAITALRRAGATRVIVAVPVAPPDQLSLLKAEADETVCLYAPRDFRAVGLHYGRFTQTPDEEVIDLLARARAPD